MSAKIRDDEVTEWRLRKRYPILCARFLDGYTVAQVARSYGWSPKALCIESDIELYEARRDELCARDLGHQLIAMADDAKRLHKAYGINRPSPAW